MPRRYWEGADAVAASPSSSQNRVSGGDLRRAVEMRQVTLSYIVLQSFIFCLQLVGAGRESPPRAIKCRLNAAKSWLSWIEVSVQGPKMPALVLPAIRTRIGTDHAERPIARRFAVNSTVAAGRQESRVDRPRRSAAAAVFHAGRAREAPAAWGKAQGCAVPKLGLRAELRFGAERRAVPGLPPERMSPPRLFHRAVRVRPPQDAATASCALPP